MILVTLGTQDKEFTRLLTKVEELVNDGKIKDKVIVQAGFTKFESKKMEVLDYIPFEQFSKYINDAELVITHGGVGSIISALKLKKKIVAVARLEKYKEHINDHQLQIIDKMSKDGYIINGNDLDKLEENIEKAKKLEVKEYTSNTEDFIKNLEALVDDLLV